ncbi:hypothetical protein [Paenibacillus sp. MSJ-34]|uniref:hypothetical protein n=1 Tax=Paenibacillus sp. MSJ-34 TaxID=2841529 RepID=UPI001C0F513A|nr:hypothetical protein [Paenibacillus sp. MSJ-34]MBU5445651.1 hypothetical protein [Paenibacillus sp. MSJ-34]
MKSRVKVLISAVLVFSLMFSGQVFASSSNEAKTEPPPLEVAPFTIFDPDFKYLDDGAGYISYNGDKKVNIWGQTLGTRKVDTIGVQLTLQRWTGNDWLDVNTGPNSTYSDASYAYYTDDIPVIEGCYYRVKSKHWIKYGNVKEEGFRYSNSILIK